jgi:multiple sugar transport system substrate-binding protein
LILVFIFSNIKKTKKEIQLPLSNNIIKISTSIFAFGVLVIGVLIIFVYPPSGVDEREENPITRIYFADNISSGHQKLIDRFNQEFQGKIEVVPVNLPFNKFSTNERKELLARSLRSKSNRIDVFAVDLIWVPRFARWCQPLDSYFTSKERNQIINYALESCYFQGQLVAMPLYIDVGMMYYRRDIIQTLPDAPAIEQQLRQSITWDEFIQLSQRFSHLNNPFYFFMADNYEGLICSFVEGIASQNQTMFSGDSVQLNTPEARKSLQLLVDLVHKYKITPVAVTKYDEFQCYFHALKTDGLFLRGWPGLRRHFRQIVADTSKIHFLEEAALPHFSGGRPAFVFGGWNLMISKFSANKAAAIQFLKFTQRQESQKMMLQEGGYLPIIHAVYQDSLLLAQVPDLQFCRSLLDQGVHRPFHVDYTKISDIISYYLNLAIAKEISVAAALEGATNAINTKQVIIK